MSATRVSPAMMRGHRRLLGPHIRCVNYHDVPPDTVSDFERQLRFFAEIYDPVGREELDGFLAGTWTPTRPGLILSFDDGLRSHAEVVAPALERHGFIGWFLVPPAFLDAAPERQGDFAREHSIDHAGSDYGDPRIAMTWDQLRDLDRRHVIGCHSFDHARLSGDLDADHLRLQTVTARHRLEDELAHDVNVFAWVGGEDWSYSRSAAAAIEDADFALSFTTHSCPILPSTSPLALGRTNIEASWPIEVVRFQLSGSMDLLYRGRRRRTTRLIAG